MKRIYSKLLIAVLLTLTGLSAQAGKALFEWNDPDACFLQTGTYLSSGTVIDVPKGATSYEVDARGFVYIIARDGYQFESIEMDGVSQKQSVNQGVIYYSKYLGESTETTIRATLVPVERTTPVYFEIINGADRVQPLFDSGLAPKLEDGENTVYINPELDASLTINCINGVEQFYSITKNGEEISKNLFYPRYYVGTISAGDKISIRVFEGEAPAIEYSTITLDLPAGFEDCVYSIYDRTAGDFLSLEEGKVTVVTGSTLKFNFKNDDWTYTSFSLNGKELESTVSDNTTSVEFKTEGDATLSVAGTARTYDDVDFTLYIYNPEGVNLTPMYYNGTPVELSEGEAIAEDINLASAGFVMTADKTRKFSFPVSSKRPMIFFSPKEGYFIYNVLGSEDGKLTEVSSASADLYGTTYYIIAKKMDNPYEVAVNINGDASRISLRGDARLSMQWDNPSTIFRLVDGEQSISFIPDYDLPLSISTYDAAAGFGVYLDGAAVAADENGVYSGIMPYYPASEGAPQYKSEITVGTSLAVSRTIVKTQDDLTAEFFYGPCRTAGKSAGQDLLVGTKIIIVPSSYDCTIKAGSTVVNGYDADGNFIDGLNEDGEYVALTGKALSTTFTVSAPVKPAPAVKLTPAAGSTVFNLAKFNVTFNSASEVSFNHLDIEIAGNGSTWTTGSVTASARPNSFVITFDEAPYETGEYTLTIPSGAFTVDGAPSEALSAVYNLENNWVLSPAPGSTIESAKHFTLSFPYAKSAEFIGGAYDILARSSSWIAPGYDVEPVADADCPTFSLTLFESAGDAPNGSLTLMIYPGVFLVDGMENADIRASYNVERAVSTEWQATPEKSVVYESYGFGVAFIFDENASVNWVNYSDVTVTFDGEEITNYQMMPEGSYLMFSFYDESFARPGSLTISIAEGAVKLAGTPLPAISYTWEVVAPKEYDFAVSPAAEEALPYLSEFTVSFPDAESAFIFNPYSSSLRNSSYSYSESGEISEVEDAEVPTFRIIFPKAETVGNYTFVVRQGTFTLDEVQESPEIEVSYKVDPNVGIILTGVDAENVTVISLDGKVLLKSAPASGIEGLEKGVYIVNGKKVSVR